ncbi:hypothetical protein ABK040_012700 [Willaertia magna]
MDTNKILKQALRKSTLISTSLFNEETNDKNTSEYNKSLKWCQYYDQKLFSQESFNEITKSLQELKNLMKQQQLNNISMTELFLTSCLFHGFHSNPNSGNLNKLSQTILKDWFEEELKRKDNSKNAFDLVSEVYNKEEGNGLISSEMMLTIEGKEEEKEFKIMLDEIIQLIFNLFKSTIFISKSLSIMVENNSIIEHNNNEFFENEMDFCLQTKRCSFSLCLWIGRHFILLVNDVTLKIMEHFNDNSKTEEELIEMVKCHKELRKYIKQLFFYFTNSIDLFECLIISISLIKTIEFDRPLIYKKLQIIYEFYSNLLDELFDEMKQLLLQQYENQSFFVKRASDTMIQDKFLIDTSLHPFVLKLMAELSINFCNVVAIEITKKVLIEETLNFKIGVTLRYLLNSKINSFFENWLQLAKQQATNTKKDKVLEFLNCF